MDFGEKTYVYNKETKCILWFSRVTTVQLAFSMTAGNLYKYWKSLAVLCQTTHTFFTQSS